MKKLLIRSSFIVALAYLLSGCSVTGAADDAVGISNGIAISPTIIGNEKMEASHLTIGELEITHVENTPTTPLDTMTGSLIPESTLPLTSTSIPTLTSTPTSTLTPTPTPTPTPIPIPTPKSEVEISDMRTIISYLQNAQSIVEEFQLSEGTVFSVGYEYYESFNRLSPMVSINVDGFGEIHVGATSAWKKRAGNLSMKAYYGKAKDGKECYYLPFDGIVQSNGKIAWQYRGDYGEECFQELIENSAELRRFIGESSNR